MDKYGEISNWDVSNVTNMNGMFYEAKLFNQPLNNWNVSKVTDMELMFDSATSFNQPLNNWNVSNGARAWPWAVAAVRRGGIASGTLDRSRWARATPPGRRPPPPSAELRRWCEFHPSDSWQLFFCLSLESVW